MSGLKSVSKPARMPVLFVGHGSPMNAVEDTPWSRAWRALGQGIPRPRAVLCASAHWYTEGTLLTGGERPRTIHDFGGFPEELYRITYPAPGSELLVREAAALLEPWRATASSDWGLDHGTWSVLVHLLPAADCPVVQVSIDARLPPEEHLRAGRALAPLREEGVLVMGSGNVTHNLRDAFSRWRRGDGETPAWALDFDAEVARALEAGDEAFLTGALETEAGRASHPTPDHYLPLLYAAGAAGPGEAVRFPTEGFDMGSLSMRAVLFGAGTRPEGNGTGA